MQHKIHRLFRPILLATITATLVSAVQPAMAGRRAAYRAAGDGWAAASSWCLQGRDWGYPGNCQFASYQQCMATASGTLSYCGINPAYAFARQSRY
jgi:Protein of unknown function (DUF3551)